MLHASARGVPTAGDEGGAEHLHLRPVLRGDDRDDVHSAPGPVPLANGGDPRQRAGRFLCVPGTGRHLGAGAEGPPARRAGHLPLREGTFGGGAWPFALEGDWDLSKPLDEWTVRVITMQRRCRRRIVAARVLLLYPHSRSTS